MAVAGLRGLGFDDLRGLGGETPSTSKRPWPIGTCGAFVQRQVREVEVTGSNPGSPTVEKARRHFATDRIGTLWGGGPLAAACGLNDPVGLNRP